MSREKKKICIKTVSYVHSKDGGLIRVADLPEETRKEVGMRLLTTYCNALYSGQAEFFPPKRGQ